MMQNYSHIAKYTRRFFSGTLISRVSGMVRDVGMAMAFGDHPSVAAFMVAFRFSHFLRRLLGEGTLQSIFIPQYQELHVQDEKKASVFFFQITALLLSILALITFVVESFVGVSLYFSSSTDVLYLFFLMFPSLIFISLYGLNISLLQCKNLFFVSSIAPFACNSIWILAVFFLAKEAPDKAMEYLSIFVLVGFVVQWLITLPGTWKSWQEGRKRNTAPLFSFPIEIRKIGRATAFGFIGVTAVQMNSFLDMLFARYADLRGPVYLWYAIRLEQLPLALIGLACVYSITPSLSSLIKAKKEDKARDLFLFGYRRVFFLVVPCMFAVFALGFPSIELLFGRGHFSLHASIETTWCLWAYALSLLPSVLVVYQSSLFYAYADFKTPMWASIISVFANIVLNAVFVFVFHWGAFSIALSTSLCAYLNYFILHKGFVKKGYLPTTYPKLSSFGIVLLAGMFALCGCIFLDRLFLGSFFFQLGSLVENRSLLSQLVHFTGQLFAFIALSAAGLLLMRKEVFFEMKNFLFTKDAV